MLELIIVLIIITGSLALAILALTWASDRRTANLRRQYREHIERQGRRKRNDI